MTIDSLLHKVKSSRFSVFESPIRIFSNGSYYQMSSRLCNQIYSFFILDNILDKKYIFPTENLSHVQNIFIFRQKCCKYIFCDKNHVVKSSAVTKSWGHPVFHFTTRYLLILNFWNESTYFIDLGLVRLLERGLA